MILVKTFSSLVFTGLTGDDVFSIYPDEVEKLDKTIEHFLQDENALSATISTSCHHSYMFKTVTYVVSDPS